MYTLRQERDFSSGAGWQVLPSRFLSPAELARLRELVRRRSATQAWTNTRMREWFLVELGLHTGLRVSEMVSLACGDVVLTDETPCVWVRRGKGGRSRIVRIGPEFAGVARRYLDWKRSIGEPTDAEAPLMAGRGGGRMHKRTAQAMVSRAYRAAGIAHHRTHDLRHTYASHLLRASGWNLRLVQKQLGHASIRTTEVYADILDPDLTAALERLYREGP